jgi:MYXO-CTERM domain-containing protein
MSLARLTPASLAVVVILLGGAASAQIKPRILIIFDTSGSMVRNSADVPQPGDGTALCAALDPTGAGKTTRVYQLKQALFEVLQGIGGLEVDWALATYPMFVDPSRTPKCPTDPSCDTQPPSSCSGHYYVTNAQDSEVSGWSARNACKVSTHDPATQQTATCGTTSCPWYAAYKTEVLKVPFAGTAPEKVMIYFDQQEDSGPSPGGLVNPEVRAGIEWWTPLGKSLFYSYGYFHKEVLLPPSDPKKPCERNVVIMFTDGVETCNNDITASPFAAPTWAANLKNQLGVTVHLVAIDVNNATLQQIATAGGGSAYFVQGTTASLKQAILDIVAKSLPPSESCNGKDDNCDGLIDEDFPLKGQPCNNGLIGACYRSGVYVCKADGSGVQCNAPYVSGTAEVCNGIDDDCDGLTDEGIAPFPCGKNVGECKAGTSTCVGGKPGCQGGIGPKPETCNGLDDDCDGVRDGMAEPCYSFSSGCDLKSGLCKGPCKLGARTCTAVLSGTSWSGVWGACVGDLGPAKEICDGIDNNCDGQIDEGAECPAGQKCVNGDCIGPCTGVEFSCPKGSSCVNGWCIPDPCNKITCPDGQYCKAGACVDPCTTMKCASWEKCIRGVCEDVTCYSPKHRCPAGQRCIGGSCAADPCAGVSCGGSEYCIAGQCRPLCESLRCGAGERCVQGECLVDPCVDRLCGQSEVCVVQSSRPTCILDPCLGPVACKKGEVCVIDGVGKPLCLIDPCDRTTCPATYTCRMGDCISDALSTKDLLATGGGGCACSVDGAGDIPGTLGLLLVAGVVVWRRRRRLVRGGQQGRRRFDCAGPWQ